MKTTADHHDAELVLRLYDLRREAVMRESRNAIMRAFLPKTFDDVKAVMTDPNHQLNAPLRQVGSYFEMAYGFCHRGILHADLMAESSGEGMYLFAKVFPFLDDIRKMTSATAFQNCEWMVANSPVARAQFERFRDRVQKMGGA